jgi:hypothetical protein
MEIAPQDSNDRYEAVKIVEDRFETNSAQLSADFRPASSTS